MTSVWRLCGDSVTGDSSYQDRGGADIDRGVRDEVEQRLVGVELHERGRGACHTPKSTVEEIKRGNQARYISNSEG